MLLNMKRMHTRARRVLEFASVEFGIDASGIETAPLPHHRKHPHALAIVHESSVLVLVHNTRVGIGLIVRDASLRKLVEHVLARCLVWIKVPREGLAHDTPENLIATAGAFRAAILPSVALLFALELEVLLRAWETSHRGPGFPCANVLHNTSRDIVLIANIVRIGREYIILKMLSDAKSLLW